MTERYTKVAVVLHWLVAIGLFLNLYSGLGFDDLPKGQVAAAVALHKSIGISVLGLVVLRLLWRVGHKPPQQAQHLSLIHISEPTRPY